MRRLLPILAAALALTGAACGDRATSAAEDGELRVVTTVAPLTSIVSAVVGDRAEIEGVVPEGTNSHTFEPAPRVAEVLSTADVIFLNGLNLEEPTKKLAEANMADDTRLVELGNSVLSEDEYLFDFSFPKEEGNPNPHTWTDPTYAKLYAEVVRETMTEVDPGGADHYRRRFDTFSQQVDALDRAMRAAFETVPRDRRKLLTYHDAYAYFAKTYGWQVVGAIQVKSFEDPTPQEVARLIDQVRSEKVPAIFGSEVFPSPVLEQIGREAGVRYVDVLRDDDLPGEPGDPEHSWAGLMRFDYLTIVEALGGDASPLRSLDLRSDLDDGARYPQ
jgi:ABC-type Zn uptake system ZnuABC Zn-binding protein ZnuA